MAKQRKWLTTYIVRAKENLKLSHGGPSHSQASGTNPQIKALCQDRWIIQMKSRLVDWLIG